MTKNTIRFSLAACLAVLIGLFALPAAAQLNSPIGAPYQTGQPNYFNLDTNAASYFVTNNQTRTFTAGGTNTYIKTIRENQGLSLFLAVWQTNSVASTTTNYTVGLDVTGDNTTWTMSAGAQPLSWTVSLAGQGASTNVYWINWPITLIDNIRKIQVTRVSTTASNNVFAALGYSQGIQ
jgi:hypothetical protein